MRRIAEAKTTQPVMRVRSTVSRPVTVFSYAPAQYLRDIFRVVVPPEPTAYTRSS